MAKKKKKGVTMDINEFKKKLDIVDEKEQWEKDAMEGGRDNYGDRHYRRAPLESDGAHSETTTNWRSSGNNSSNNNYRRDDSYNNRRDDRNSRRDDNYNRDDGYSRRDDFREESQADQDNQWRKASRPKVQRYQDNRQSNFSSNFKRDDNYHRRDDDDNSFRRRGDDGSRRENRYENQERDNNNNWRTSKRSKPQQNSNFRSFGNNRRNDRYQIPIPDQPPYTSFVSNLADDTQNDDLQDFFRGCNVIRCYVVRDRETNKPRGHAFVEFSTKEDLEYGIEKKRQ